MPESSESLIGVLRELAHALGSRDASTESMVAKLGDRAVDLQGNVVVQEPTLAGVNSASVVRQVGTNSNAPAHITLELESSLSLDELRQAFGEPRIVAADHPGQSKSAVFPLVDSVRVIGDVRDGAVRRITLMRDVTLTDAGR